MEVSWENYGPYLGNVEEFLVENWKWNPAGESGGEIGLDFLNGLWEIWTEFLSEIPDSPPAGLIRWSFGHKT